MDLAELLKTELPSLLACPYTEAATAALEEDVELSNMLPVAEVAGGPELEEMFKKLKSGFAEPCSGLTEIKKQTKIFNK